MIERLFPPDVVSVAASAAMWNTPPAPEEAAAVVNAVAKRRREFAAGRACAREALSRLGIRDYPLLNDADGLPVWPVGVVGCLAHCAGYCGVAVARAGRIQSVGFDSEPTSLLAEELRGMICSEPERNWIDSKAPPTNCEWYKVFFCAKEGAFKAAFPVLRVPIDFWKIEVAFRPDSSEFVVGFPSPYEAMNGRVAGRFAVSETHILAGVSLYRSPA